MALRRAVDEGLLDQRRVVQLGLRGTGYIVGADLVELSPPYDTSGNTALLGANLLFEMLCILPGVARRD